MFRNADVEKTQAPPPIEPRKSRFHEGNSLQDQIAGAGECSRPMTDSEILAELFRYHPPTVENLPKFAAINQAAKNFAEIFCKTARPRPTDPQ